MRHIITWGFFIAFLKMSEARNVARMETSRQMREGGGFLVRRPIGDSIKQCDPFLMLDHLGPVVYGPGEAVGAPDHPHRGFETVTYLIDGMNEFYLRDFTIAYKAQMIRDRCMYEY